MGFGDLGFSLPAHESGPVFLVFTTWVWGCWGRWTDGDGEYTGAGQGVIT